MRSSGRHTGGLLLAALLTACGSAAPPIVLRPIAASTLVGVNGRYRGTVRLIRATGAYCPRSGARVLEISGDSITLSYSAAPRQRVPLTAQVAPDGRIQASDGEGTMEGQLTNGRLEITVASHECEHRWTLTRVE
jgi:hypothetical protein